MRVLFDHAPVCIPGIDTDGRLLTVNRAGLDPVCAGGEDEVCGQANLDSVSPQDKGRIRRLRKRPFGVRPRVSSSGGTGKDGPRYDTARFMTGPAVDGRIDRLIGSTTAITDRQEAETGLRHLNRSYALLSRCNNSLARAADERDLLHAFCRNLVDAGGYRYAWIGYASDEPTLRVSMKAHAGHGNEPFFTAVIAVTAGANAQDHSDPCRTAILTGRPVIFQDIEADLDTVPWRETARGLGFRSMIALPLVADGQSIGHISIFSAETNAFDDKEVALLAELATALTFGIETARAGAALAQQVRYLREEAEQNERRRIAATLHDGVGQSLQAINLGLKRLRVLAGDGQPLNTEILDPLIAEVGDAIGELREISQELRPRFLERLALHEAIRFHCSELDKRSETRIRCLANLAPYALGGGGEGAVFPELPRGPGQRAQARQRHPNRRDPGARAAGFLTVCIADNGTGFDPPEALDRPAGLGLSMIAERAESIGGRAEILSTPEEGTQVRITVPLSKENSRCR